MTRAITQESFARTSNLKTSKVFVRDSYLITIGASHQNLAGGRDSDYSVVYINTPSQYNWVVEGYPDNPVDFNQNYIARYNHAVPGEPNAAYRTARAMERAHEDSLRVVHLLQDRSYIHDVRFYFKVLSGSLYTDKNPGRCYVLNDIDLRKYIEAHGFDSITDVTIMATAKVDQITLVGFAKTLLKHGPRRPKNQVLKRFIKPTSKKGYNESLETQQLEASLQTA